MGVPHRPLTLPEEPTERLSDESIDEMAQSLWYGGSNGKPAKQAVNELAEELKKADSWDRQKLAIMQTLGKKRAEAGDLFEERGFCRWDTNKDSYNIRRMVQDQVVMLQRFLDRLYIPYSNQSFFEGIQAEREHHTDQIISELASPIISANRLLPDESKKGLAIAHETSEQPGTAVAEITDIALGLSLETQAPKTPADVVADRYAHMLGSITCHHR